MNKFFHLCRYPFFGYDTETTGIRYPLDRAFGFSIATPNGKSDYWDIRECSEAIDWLNEEMEGYQGRIIAHNASFDYKMSHAAGIRLPITCLDDTVIRACLLDEHLVEYGLDFLSGIYLGDLKDEEIYLRLAEIFGGKATRNQQMLNIARAPSSIVAPYAKKDAELTLKLWQWQEEEINRQEIADCPSLREIMEFERSLMPTLIKMEMSGIRVDIDKAEMAARDLTPIIDQQQREIQELAGGPININSSTQIRKLFDPVMSGGDWFVGQTLIPKTDSGAPSFDANVLRSLENDKRAELILSIRSLIKTRDTFLLGHVVGHAVGDRVYPTINQSKGEMGGTGTGRLSIVSPAMQQIPSRNKRVAAIVKPVFLPDEGQVWIDADESSHEVRIFAHLLAMVGENQVVAEYARNPNTDFHQFVADLTGLPRNATYSGQPNAKQLNLSAIFNSGNGSIAETMGMPWEWDSFIGSNGSVVKYKKAGSEAMDVINRYHAALPGVRRLAQRCKTVAEDRGFIYTKKGRRIRFYDRSKSYKASGLLIQATAADYNKENIIWSNEILEQHGGRLLLNIHDSYSMSCPEESVKPMWQQLLSKLEDRSRANVPLILEMSGIGHNWWHALTSGNKL